MFLRVDQEADRNLVRHGYWSNKRSSDYKGIREFRVYAYESKDMEYVKDFVRDNYPKVWY